MLVEKVVRKLEGSMEGSVDRELVGYKLGIVGWSVLGITLGQLGNNDGFIDCNIVERMVGSTLVIIDGRALGFKVGSEPDGTVVLNEGKLVG
jgi:hypothetical protein